MENVPKALWGAAIFAKFHKLGNLIIVDYNNISATDFTKNFTSNTNLEKFKSFIDGKL